MARNGFGTDITRRTGSMNKGLLGMTYLKNGVQRVRVVPANPQTADQQDVRGAFAYLTTAWAMDLSDSDRETWEAARTGNAYYAVQDDFYGVTRNINSAKSLFISMNMNILVATGTLGAPTITFITPGTPNVTDGIAFVSLVGDDSSNTLVFTFTGTFTNYYLVGLLTPPVSAGIMRTTSIKSAFRVITNGQPTSPQTISNYVARWPLTDQTGQKIFYNFSVIDGSTGKSTFLTGGNIIVVA